jgi:predicted lysophospholipase L1 biosynthesis ABC-type transport system permease subunit
VLPALLGAVVGVMGIVGALTFADGIDDATSHPERFGVYAELETFLGFNDVDDFPAEEVGAALAAVDGVAAVNDNRTGVAEARGVEMATFTFAPIDEPPSIVMIDGAMPEAADEVALAPGVADAIDVEVGDRFELTGATSTGEVRVTGLAFVPEGPHNGYDEGAWLTAAGHDDTVGGFKFHIIDVTAEEGADLDALMARIDREVPAAIGADGVTEVATPRVPPARVEELKQLQRLPLYLAAFLGILAVTAVGHAVATAVRRRRRDLAVIRAVGFTRWQSRAIALSQAVVLALVGVVFGVPLGVALGRSLWRSVAESTPVLYVEPIALLALVLIAPIAIGLAVLLAAWPSQRAARLRVGQVLRTE